MKLNVVALLFLLITFPTITLALACNKSGYTVVYINGILTSKQEADKDTDSLRKRFEKDSSIKGVIILNGYNPSHLAGAGDLYKSIQQALQKATPTVVEDFDLKTILMQIHPQVSTRKILLVGHSQGTFYTNSIYRYLRENGVPEKSVAVYNLATPAYYVEGGGNYLTSSNDRLIERVRKWTVGAGVVAPLRANITIPLPENELNDDAGGHYFSSDYLAGAPEKVVSDITNGLAGLKAGASQSSDGCFTPPPENFAYKVQKLTFAVADPLARATTNGAKATGNAIATAAQKTYAAAARVQNAIANIFRTVSPQGNALAGQGASVALAVAPTPTETKPLSNEQTPIVVKAATQESQNKTESQSQPEQKNLVQKSENTSQTLPLVPMQSLNPITAGFGGSGNPLLATSASTQSAASSSTSATSTATSTASAPVILPFAIISPAENAVFGAATVSFTGTTSPSASVTASYATTTATTTASAGNWSFTFALQQGTTTVSFVSSNSAGESSATTTRTVSVDLTPPSAPTLTINECSFSLATSTCFIATMTVTASWNSISDASYYGLAKNGALLSTTTATTATATASDNATTTFAVVAYDAAGNSATSTASVVQVMTRPFVINEVAWAGTDASDSDEWIKLKNRSGYTLDVSRLAIVATDGSPYIQLTGTVDTLTNGVSNHLYLIERAQEAADVNLLHNPVIAFDQLSGSGEELQLVWGHGSASTTIDATPAVALCSGWCAGSQTATLGFSLQSGTTTAKRSMERKDASVDGAIASNWQNSDTYTLSASDRAGGIIFGTPGKENSTGLPIAGWYCAPETVSITAGAHYAPTTDGCTYLSRFINTQANRFGGLFRGEVGSSTAVNGHFLSKAFKKDESDSISSPVSGEHFFVAIWEALSGPVFNNDSINFNTYFTTASTTGAAITTPPHDNYKVIPWIYGP